MEAGNLFWRRTRKLLNRTQTDIAPKGQKRAPKAFEEPRTMHLMEYSDHVCAHRAGGTVRVVMGCPFEGTVERAS